MNIAVEFFWSRFRGNVLHEFVKKRLNHWMDALFEDDES